MTSEELNRDLLARAERLMETFQTSTCSTFGASYCFHAPYTFPSGVRWWCPARNYLHIEAPRLPLPNLELAGVPTRRVRGGVQQPGHFRHPAPRGRVPARSPAGGGQPIRHVRLPAPRGRVSAVRPAGLRGVVRHPAGSRLLAPQGRVPTGSNRRWINVNGILQPLVHEATRQTPSNTHVSMYNV